MAIDKLDSKAASTLFAEQAKAQGDTAKAVASLLRASLNAPSLAKVADNMASSVYEAASKALAQIEGTPLNAESIKAGKQAARTIHGALVDMANFRGAYWDAYQAEALPKNVRWLPEPSGRLDTLAKTLAAEAKNGPVAFKVNSIQIMFAKPGDDGAAVFQRWQAAKEQAESGGALGNMRQNLERLAAKADGLRAIDEAVETSSEGRPTAVLIADLRQLARDKYAPEATPPTAYVGMGLKTLAHPKEMERLLEYAAVNLRDHHQTSVSQFLGNVRFQMGHGLNQAGTDDAWNAAIESVRVRLADSEPRA